MSWDCISLLLWLPISHHLLQIPFILPGTYSWRVSPQYSCSILSFQLSRCVCTSERVSLHVLPSPLAGECCCMFLDMYQPGSGWWGGGSGIFYCSGLVSFLSRPRVLAYQGRSSSVVLTLPCRQRFFLFLLLTARVGLCLCPRGEMACWSFPKGFKLLSY